MLLYMISTYVQEIYEIGKRKKVRSMQQNTKKWNKGGIGVRGGFEEEVCVTFKGKFSWHNKEKKMMGACIVLYCQ